MVPKPLAGVNGTQALRYAAVAVAFCCLFVAIFFSFNTLFEQKRLLDRDSKINIWFLAQTEIEYLRLMQAFAEFRQTKTITRDDVSDRFEVFWSRLPILVTGEQAATLRQVTGLSKAVAGIIMELEQIEPMIDRLSITDGPLLDEVGRRLNELRTPVHDLVTSALLYDSAYSKTRQEEREGLYYQLLAIFAAILLSGLALIFLFSRQLLRARQLFGEARTAEAAARSAREELVVAIESISEGFILYDQNDRVVLFNQRYNDLHPATAKFLVAGVTFESLLRQAIAGGGIKVNGDVEAWIKGCLASHANPGDSFESKLTNGSWLKISERRMADGRLVGVHTDITELKRREMELVQKTSTLQATLDNVNQGIAVFDADEHLVSWNQMFLDNLNLPADAVALGIAYQDIVRRRAASGQFGPGDPEGHVVEHQNLLAEARRNPTGHLRFERRQPNGAVIETMISLMPGGGFIKTYLDITERVRAEEERAKLLDQFHAAQKMQAIGTLAAGIAHDFNNILSTILGNCSLLTESLAKRTTDLARVEQVSKASIRARDLVKQILTYSRKTEVTLEPLDSAPVVVESLQLIRATIPANVEIATSVAQACVIKSDRTQLHQILLNLCTNAAHAIGTKAGRLTVALDVLDASRGGVDPFGRPETSLPIAGKVEEDAGRSTFRMVLGNWGRARFVRISATDTGCGMDGRTMQRIFDPFFTTKEIGKGTGLGLAAVQGIVQLHGGCIAVESIMGRGTRFDILLPAHEIAMAPAPSAAPSEDLGAVTTGNETIMLVDDDRMLLEVTQLMLEKAGYSVEAFSDPRQALDRFRLSPDHWDVIVTDRSMPKLRGEDLVQQIRVHNPVIPIVMCTGYNEPADEDFARSIGVNEYLSKPVRAGELCRAVRRALKVWRVKAAA